MRIERKKNASRNIVYGFIVKIYNLLLPFIMRSVMIKYLGVEYLGLNSLFSSILSVLNLAELGVGSAMVFSMYKPIAEDDDSVVCALLVLYRHYYRIIGLAIFSAGIAILPFIPRLIHGGVPNGLNVYILYFLNLLATVFSYWLFAYRNSVLRAHQRNDVISKIALCSNTLKYMLQLAVLVFIKNYYWYVITIIATQIINNVVTAIISKRMYPQLYPYGDLSEEVKRAINKRIQDVFTAKLGGTILNSADTIVISSFIGLKMLAIYQNYYFIMNSVAGILSIVFTAITAGVGNSLVLETKEKNYKDYKTLSLIIFSFIAFCTASMRSLYQPFIAMWVGEELLLSENVVVMICIYFIIVEYLMLASVYKDAAGIWHQDRFRPLISGVANLGLNLLMVRSLGLFGILLSTILSAGVISVPWITINLFKYIFPGQLRDYLFFVLRGITCIILSIVSSNVLSESVTFTGIAELVIKLAISAISSMSICLVLFRNTEEFSKARRLVFSIIGAK